MKSVVRQWIPFLYRSGMAALLLCALWLLMKIAVEVGVEYFEGVIAVAFVVGLTFVAVSVALMALQRLTASFYGSSVDEEAIVNE